MSGYRTGVNHPSPPNKVATVIIGGILIFIGVALALGEVALGSAFCILLGISFVLIGNDERPVGLGFLVAALVCGGIGLALLLR
jgi:hypothetical protein